MTFNRRFPGLIRNPNKKCVSDQTRWKFDKDGNPDNT